MDADTKYLICPQCQHSYDVHSAGTMYDGKVIWDGLACEMRRCGCFLKGLERKKQPEQMEMIQ